MNPVMPLLVSLSRTGTLFHLFISGIWAKLLDHRHLSVCWMNAVLRCSSLQPEACMTFLLTLIILLAIFVLLGRILRIKRTVLVFNTKYCSIKSQFSLKAAHHFLCIVQCYQCDSPQFSLLLLTLRLRLIRRVYNPSIL